MQGIQYIYAYLIGFASFLVLDMLWLGLLARDFYKQHLASFMGDVQWGPAFLFYAIYIAGVLVFAVLPALREQSFTTALVLGAFLGLLAYATYDLTNLAVLRDWPRIVTVVDIVWGTVLTSSVSVITYLIMSRIVS